jgi:hypothetical protein
MPLWRDDGSEYLAHDDNSEKFVVIRLKGGKVWWQQTVAAAAAPAGTNYLPQWRIAAAVEIHNGTMRLLPLSCMIGAGLCGPDVAV